MWVRVGAQALEYTVGKRAKRATLLTGVSGALYPGQLLALVHPHALLPRMHAASGIKWFSLFGTQCALITALRMQMGPSGSGKTTLLGALLLPSVLFLLLTDIRHAVTVSLSSDRRCV